MKGLVAYSGISTKIHAMKGNLISTNEYIELANMTTISDMVGYLSKHPGYEFILTDLDFSFISRGSLEELISYSPCADFKKLYTFANLSQKKFIETFFINFEMKFIKAALRRLYNNSPISIETANLEKLFAGHTDFDLKIVSQSTSVDELITNLKGSIFFEPLSLSDSISSPTLFDYEISLDLFYFKMLWKTRDLFNKQDKNILSNAYGRQIDMLNIMWIYRTKKYYNISPAQVFSYLIPVNYKLSHPQVSAMVESDSISDFLSILDSTYYGKFFAMEKHDKFENSYTNIMDKLHNKNFRNNPYSLAAISTYIYMKEQEIKKIITLAECIRYKYPPDKIISNLNLIGGTGQ